MLQLILPFHFPVLIYSTHVTTVLQSDYTHAVDSNEGTHCTVNDSIQSGPLSFFVQPKSAAVRFTSQRSDLMQNGFIENINKAALLLLVMSNYLFAA